MSAPNDERRYRKSKDIGKIRWAPPKPNFTLMSLVCLVSAFAVAFAASNWLGGYGNSIGFLVVWAAFGGLFQKRNWTIGGLASAIFLLAVPMVAWHQAGTIGIVDRRMIREANFSFHHFIQALEVYNYKFGSYPKTKSELLNSTALDAITAADLPFYADNLQYERVDKSYSLIFLGRDGKRGGVGLDSDCDEPSVRTYASRRVPLGQFFYDRNGDSRVSPLCIPALILGFAISVAFHDRTQDESKTDAPKQGSAKLYALNAFLIAGSALVAIWLGGAMAIYCIFSQHSGH